MSATSKARRKAKREAEGFDRNTRIQLSNPVSDHFAPFIVGNAQYVERVVEEGTAKGQHIVICGAGPSLADDAAAWCAKGDQLWGCNSALTWLADHGHRPTHGFTVDQTPQMCVEWKTAPPVDYLVASTIHPHLTDLLRAHGRPLTWFHNFVGIKRDPVAFGVCKGCSAVFDRDGSLTDFSAFGRVQDPPKDCPHAEIGHHLVPYEEWLYLTLYPPTVRVGSGLNTVTRAIDVALFLGAKTITVLGADCALRVKRPQPEGIAFNSPEHRAWLDHDVQMHADGGGALASGATPVTLSAVIDGRHWETKPDMAITATWMVKMKKKLGDRLNLVGDTLPNALMHKDDAFLARLPALVDQEGKPIDIDYAGWEG